MFNDEVDENNREYFDDSDYTAVTIMNGAEISRVPVPDEDKDRWIHCKQFAEKLGAQLALDGHVGFGRPCVGVSKNGEYLYTGGDDKIRDPSNQWLGYESVRVPLNEYRALQPTEDVESAYHKHDCMAILVPSHSLNNVLEGMTELYYWIRNIESHGTPYTDDYQACYGSSYDGERNIPMIATRNGTRLRIKMDEETA